MLVSGANSLTASYAGDDNYDAPTSAAVSVGYSATAPVNAITFTASPAAAATRQPVTFTANVTTGGIPATSGTVEFFDGTVSLGTAQVVGSAPAKGFVTGSATLKTILAFGNHQLKATYHGIFTAPTPVTSTAAAVNVTGTLPSSIALTATPNSSNSANYDLTATVSGYGAAVPTAPVSIDETSVIDHLGTVSVDSAHPVHGFQPPWSSVPVTPQAPMPRSPWPLTSMATALPIWRRRMPPSQPAA
jgi:Bacterial Ig-like domain (group 3)